MIMKTVVVKYLLLGCFFVLVVLLVGSLSPSLARANDVKGVSASESDLKAVYLYNFLRFVRWPDDGVFLANDAIPIKKIAVVGDCSCTDALRRLQSKLAGSDRTPVTLVIHGPFREGMDLCHCNVLYICDSEKSNMARIIKSLGDAPVLTVADGESFMAVGGMVSLLHYQNTVRWSINRAPLNRTGLRVSAKLFDIAINVIDDQNSSFGTYSRWLARLEVPPEVVLKRWVEGFCGCSLGQWS